MKGYKRGVTIPDYDERVTQALASIELDDGGRMVFGIRNLEGEIYRVIRIECLGNVMRAVRLLNDAGFVDELKDTYVTNPQGFDGIWSPAS